MAPGLGRSRIVIGRINSQIALAGYPYVPIVQAAEASYVAADPLATLVDEDSVSPGANGHIHYTSDGNIAIGLLYAPAVRAARALITATLRSRATTPTPS